MKNFKLLKFLLIIKGLIFFLFFLIIPILFSSLLVYILDLYLDKSLLFFFNNKNFILTILRFAIFFVMFLFFYLNKSRIINFIKEENWFISFDKALIPAIITFAFAFLISFFILRIVNYLPEGNIIKKWISIPNKGLIDLIDEINNKNPFLIISYFFILIVFAPISEEILFRGFLQDSFEKIFKLENVDIILVSLIFSFFHINSLSNAIFAFIAGLFLSKQRQKTRSINITIWIHCLINFAGIVFAITFKYLLKINEN